MFDVAVSVCVIINERVLVLFLILLHFKPLAHFSAAGHDYDLFCFARDFGGGLHAPFRLEP